MKDKYCACGRKLYNRNNSTIQPKQCPSCKLKNMLSGSDEAVKKGLEAKRTRTKKKVAKKSVKTTKSTKTKSGKKRTKKVNLDKALDNAWAVLIKLIAGGKCEYCGNRTTLNSHHVFTRTNKSLRWRTINGICLCAFHHTLSSKFSAHGTPTIFTEWVLKYRGEKWHNELRMIANSPGKFHKFEKEIILQELNKEIKSYE